MRPRDQPPTLYFPTFCDLREQIIVCIIHLTLSFFIQNKIPRQLVCLVGWFVGAGLGITVVYGIYTVNKKGGRPFNQAENIIYGTFSRFVWGLAVAWVVYACHKGYGSKKITTLMLQNLFTAKPAPATTYSDYSNPFTRSTHHGYFSIYVGNRKFPLENQVFRAIPFGQRQKIWAVILVCSAYLDLLCVGSFFHLVKFCSFMFMRKGSTRVVLCKL